MALKTLFTATAVATGGRNGHSAAQDGSVDVNLSIPKEMGGPGKPGTTTPEHLFATGYAACFSSALDFVARQQKKEARDAVVTCAVSIGVPDGGGFGLAAKLDVALPHLAQADAEALVAQAHTVCPYSRAIKGNVDVALSVKGG